jgi:predicted lipid-binding transport protein (Tim44 family)
MKGWWIGVVAVALVAAGMPDTSEARRFGGGAGSGMQRSMPQRAAPQPPAPAPRPAQPPNAPAQQPGAAAPAAAGAAASTAGRSWMGPLAGLAAGLGIAALLSHMGLGGAFAEFLMLALLLAGGFFLVRFLMRRMGSPAPAAQGAGPQPRAASVSERAMPQAPVQRSPLPAQTPASSGLHGGAGAATGSARDGQGSTLPPLNPVLPADGSAPAQAVEAQDTPTAAQAAPGVFVPATFDSEGFARVAKAIFLRLQAANDTGDLDDIRRFTTPEMFAEARLQLQERGGVAQTTDVRSVDAEVLDVAEEDGRQVVSVRYRGEIVEESGQAPQSFDEVWHLVKPLDDSRSWAIAGIEQMR